MVPHPSYYFQPANRSDHVVHYILVRLTREKTMSLGEARDLGMKVRAKHRLYRGTDRSFEYMSSWEVGPYARWWRGELVYVMPMREIEGEYRHVDLPYSKLGKCPICDMYTSSVELHKRRRILPWVMLDGKSHNFGGKYLCDRCWIKEKQLFVNAKECNKCTKLIASINKLVREKHHEQNSNIRPASQVPGAVAAASS